MKTGAKNTEALLVLLSRTSQKSVKQASRTRQVRSAVTHTKKAVQDGSDIVVYAAPFHSLIW